MIIITDDMRNNLEYDGRTPKFGVTINKNKYIVKTMKNGSSSVYSEYVASNFISKIGYDAHMVKLGYYNGIVGYREYDGLVNVIKDFSNDRYTLHSFKDLGESSVDTSLNKKVYAYKEVEKIIKSIVKSDNNIKEIMLRRFWQMYICDAILGNRDRHWGNWGFLKDNIEHKLLPAPIYDNGACLFPDVLNNLYQLNIDTYNFLYDRTIKFPASLLKAYRSDEKVYKRTNYKTVFSDLRISKVLVDERNKLISRIGGEGVFNAIIEVTSDNDIPIELVNFYRMIVMCRYYCIVERMDFDIAYRKSMNILRGYII